MEENIYRAISAQKVYISGPMTGLPNYNYPAFFAMEKKLNGEFPSCCVLNPANIDNLYNIDTISLLPPSRTWYLTTAVQMLLECRIVVLLPGWEESPGALLEVQIARELDMVILDDSFNPVVFPTKVKTPNEDDRNILDIAKDLVNGPRQKTYGHPKNNFSDIGRIWGTLLGIDDIKPETVALMMIGLKLAREKHMPTKDNMVDTIGYVLAHQMCIEQPS